MSCEDAENHSDTHSDLCDNFGHTFEGITCGGERMVVNEQNGTQTVNGRKSQPCGIMHGPRLGRVQKIGGRA